MPMMLSGPQDNLLLTIKFRDIAFSATMLCSLRRGLGVIHVLCYFTTLYQLLKVYGFGYKWNSIINRAEEARREEEVTLHS
jgi:hypothetical protein